MKAGFKPDHSNGTLTAPDQEVVKLDVEGITFMKIYATQTRIASTSLLTVAKDQDISYFSSLMGEPDQAKLWHSRICHLGHAKLVESGIDVGTDEEPCETCIQGKPRFFEVDTIKSLKRKPSRVGELVGLDLMIPQDEETGCFAVAIFLKKNLHRIRS